MPRNVLVTGAGGFVGSALVDRLLSAGVVADTELERITLLDLSVPERHRTDERVRVVEGSIAHHDVRAAALADGPDLVFHLACVPGRATNDDVALGWSVNVDGSLALFDAVAATAKPTDVVFTSSIGVYGTPMPSELNDDTYPRPSMSYGAQKLIAEVAFADMIRRERFRGRAVRLSGIVPRPRSARSALSYASFISDSFHALAAGERFEFPVGSSATSLLMSRERCIDNLVHAATLPPVVDGAIVFTLPALRVSMAELAAKLAAYYGHDVADLVTYRQEPSLQAQFGALPTLSTGLADTLGFRADSSLEELIRRADVTPTSGRKVMR